MAEISVCDSLIAAVDRRLQTSGLLESDYFVTLQTGQMTRRTFEETQLQFFFAVRFFSRAMAALAARIPDSATRRPLIHNLAEEHGLSDEVCSDSSNTFHPELAHDRTFVLFLSRLGVTLDAARIEGQQRTSVRAFNLALWAACATEDIRAAFACLGAIEYAFADISAKIGNGLVAHGWMNREQLIHYKLHAEIDKRHAGDFFDVIEDAWTQDAAVRRQVDSGLDLGFYIFKRLYDDLLAEAAIDDE